MRYDFGSIIDRSHCGSSKWEGMKQHNPSISPPDVIPLSVADMEFMTAPSKHSLLSQELYCADRGCLSCFGKK